MQNAQLFIAITFYLCLCVLSIESKDGPWLNTTRLKRATCDETTQFQCVSSKTCIDADNRCNAVVDCPDSSDETTDCKNLITCPGFIFTCDYGACIEKKRRCDGKKDCWDNSDEANCIIDSGDKSEGDCSSNQFECNSGQCIDLDNKCNGKPDCADGSDETKATCLNVYCPGFTFKCNYGACIDGFRKCNGVRDCVDGSDEENCGGPRPTPPTPTPPTIPTRPSTMTGDCKVPEPPEHGRWSSNVVPGSTVAESTSLLYACDHGYRARDTNSVHFIACLGGKWQPKLPVCEKLCPAQYSENMMQLTCYDNDRSKNEIKCNEAIHGSIAKAQCAKFFEFPNRPKVREPITLYCYRGKWNIEFPQCVPVCGEKRVSVHTLIVNGGTVELGNYPWVAAIFLSTSEGQINVCGGSMLTQNIILTAAHCVTNDDGEPLATSSVKIAVGKYFNKYNDPRDKDNAQYSDIERIVKPDKYTASGNNFQSDIALLVTKKRLNFSKYVQPVCYQNINQINLKVGQEGIVTGWGYTLANKSPSDELKELVVPYKDDATCRKELPAEFFRFATIDKFCAGHYNKSLAVCKGDSGGGLVFQNNDDRYYVIGLVSVAHILENQCNIMASSFYTNVKQHYEWVEENVSKYTIDIREPR